METWRRVIREGWLPQLSIDQIIVLRTAIINKDDTLIQQATTNPLPLDCVKDWDCEGACPLAFPGWKTKGLTTVGEVEEYFVKICSTVAKKMGKPQICSYLLNWWDDTSRDIAFKELNNELELELQKRMGGYS